MQTINDSALVILEHHEERQGILISELLQSFFTDLLKN